MRTVEVRRSVRSSPDRVFDVLADPASYLRFPGVRATKLLREGRLERLGVGAVRQIDLAMRGRLVEEITHFDRGRQLDYQIIRSTPPAEHLGGTIRFTPAAHGGHVTWTSTFRARIPVLGGLATALLARRFARAFDDAIRIADDIAAAG